MRAKKQLIFKYSLALLIFIAGQFCEAQNEVLVHAHSHNDYKQQHPLTDALALKFKSIEADIFLIKGKLIVSHTYPLLKRKTLEELYLQPLSDSIQKNGTLYKNEPLILLIDIKSDAEKTFNALDVSLKKYKNILSSFENNKMVYRNITIILSGNKPYKQVAGSPDRYMFIDEDLENIESSTYDASVCLMASTKFKNIFHKKEMSDKEKQQFNKLLEIAHKQGKTARLWAIPENEVVWEWLLENKLDLINTNKLKRLSVFLRKK